MRSIAILLGVVAALAFSDVRAEGGSGTSDGDFTFRRVAAPPKGQKPKIDVQVDPSAYESWMAGTGKPDATVVSASAAAPTMPISTGWEWFWSSVSAARIDAGPANVTAALTALESHGAVAPRLQTMQDIAERHGREILSATVGTDVSPALVIALISIESSGRADAESHKGAQGLMQLIPDTAARFGVDDPTDPAQNIKGGVAYLDWLMEKFDHDPILALAGYNAGENAVIKSGGVPPYAETRAYVPKVLTAWRVARGLCLTPPELVTDACVFAVKG